MKILYLHQYFNTPAMASSTRSYEMGRRLVSYGHKVDMVTSYRREDIFQDQGWFQTVEAGMNVHWLPVAYSNMMSYRERMNAFLKFAWKASLKAASINCDVIFASSTPLTIALPAVYGARKQKVPMVFEVRDLWPELPIAIGAIKNPLLKVSAKRLERFAYSKSRQIVALSPGMKDGIIATGYPAEKVSIIPNSCDIEFFDVGPEPGAMIRNSYEWLQDRPLVLYTGTIGIINGVEYLAHLAGAVKRLDHKICFVVIGSGQRETKLREEAEKFDVLNKNFFILPRVPKFDVPGWLSAADMAASLFVDLEEMWSNSANKFFDALAAGRPVMINYRGWQAEIIQETGAGVVLNPRDVESSAILLVEKIRDKYWLQGARKAARKLAKEQFDRNKLAKKLEGVLIQAAESK